MEGLENMCSGYVNIKKRVRDYLRPVWYLLRSAMRWCKMSIIANNLTCIESGYYKILLSDRTIIYKEAAKEFAKQFEAINADQFKRLRNMQITIKDKNLNSTFCGQAVMMTSNNECKIFDIKNMQVLSILDEASKKKFHDIYNVFQGKLKMTYMFDTNEGVVEKIIQNIPRNTWSHKLIIENYFRILSDQWDYLKQAPIAGKVMCQDIWNDIQNFEFVELNEIGERIYQKIEGSWIIPCVFLHRDMHFGNTLFDGKELYYIDFEYAKNEIFLYDIFNCMFVEVMLNHEPLLLTLYIEKDAHMFKYLHKIFDAVGMIFNEDRYLDYMYIFLLARLKFICVMSSKRPTSGKQRKLNIAQKKYFGMFCDYLEGY